MRLFRTVGFAELALIAQSDFLGFPPRLAEQPYFYPVLHLDYAIQIARDWNTQAADSGYGGFVTRFELDDDFAGRYKIHAVGQSGAHQEMWVPASEIDEFNGHIDGYITIVETFVGDNCEETIDFKSRLPIRVAQRLQELGLN